MRWDQVTDTPARVCDSHSLVHHHHHLLRGLYIFLMANRWLSDLHVSRSICLLLLILASPALSSKVGPAPPPTADPFADPKHDPNNPLKYIASNVLTGIAFSELSNNDNPQRC